MQYIPQPPMPSTLLENRYAVVRPVGTGTHGQVFEALDRVSGERVAMKHIRRATGGSTGLSEFSAVLTVDHPCIVRCLDFHYLSNGDTCLVYEFVAGGTLREQMTEGDPVGFEVWERVARDTLSALAHLHIQQILHCDLKPENILCFPLPEAQTRYMLSDLGVARYLHQRASLGRSTTPNGAPAYMAPENFYHQVSPASDLYSLGIILFELATGRRPFEGDIRSIARAHIQTPPNLDLISDPAQRDFIRWLINKDPCARPRSALDALRSLNGLEPASETLNPRVSLPILQPLQPLTAYELDQEFEQNTHSHQLIPLTLQGRPTLAAIHDGHIELFDGTNGRALNRFLPCLSGTLHLYPDGTLLATQPGRLVVWEGDFRLPRAVFELDGKPRSALLSRTHSHVIWVEDDRAFIRAIDTQNGGVHKIVCPASGLRPRLLLPPEDSQADFIVVPGTPRPEALWIDLNGNVLARRVLPGPVIDSSHTAFPAIICATPGELPSTNLTLVVFGQPGDIALITFAAMPCYYAFCEDGVVLTNADGVISFISAGGHTSSLGRIEDTACTILFAPRREFYFTVNETGQCRRFKLHRLP